MISEPCLSVKPSLEAKKTRVAFLTEIPTPYRDPLFERFQEIDSIDLTVLYCAPTERGRGWTVPPNTKTKYKILKGFLWTFSGNDIFAYKINFSIWKELSEGTYDCVVIGGYAHLTMQIAALRCRLHHVPYVLVSETHGLNKRSLWKRVLKYPIVRLVVKGAAAYLPTGTNALDYIVSYGGKKERAFLMPNAPDVERLRAECEKHRPNKIAVKNSLGIKTRLVILFAARLVAVKGFDYLLDAFERLSKERDDVSLVAAGDGPLLKKYQKDAAARSIRNAHFLGFVPYEELPKFFAIADLFVLPSWSEPWGAVVHEAMACELPVIATQKVGAARDLVEDGQTGFIVGERDPEQLYQAIKKLIETDSLRQRITALSLAKARKWSYDFCLESFKQAIETALRRI